MISPELPLQVKNCVLAALSQLDSMQAQQEQACADGPAARAHGVAGGAMPAPSDHASLLAKMGDMRAGLNQTLDTVLSQAMVREVVHGIYVPRTVAVKVDEVLRVGVYARGPLFPIRTSPCQLPAVDIDPQLLRHIHRNAVSNAAKYGKRGGVVATEIEAKQHWLTLRVINEPGEGHERMRGMDPGQIFDKGARFHESQRGLVMVSKGDGAWIMKKCSDCLQGTCSYAFEPQRTVFTLKCPAPERLDEAELEGMPLGDNVWGVGVDDCEFQRLILGGIFEQVGLPYSRVDILGERPEDLEGLTDSLVRLMRERLPAHARVLAIVDENLDLEDASLTISGSHAVQAAREQLTPAEESRLLVLIRSANDSNDDVMSYLERAHGFLSKAPIESDRKVIKRAWFRRFGVNRSPMVEREDRDEASLSLAQVNLKAANKELRKAIRLVDQGRMQWIEMWKWLHRIKGIVATIKACLTDPEQRAVAKNVVAMIERMRPQKDGAEPPRKPADLDGQWMTIKRLLMWLMESAATLSPDSPIDSPQQSPQQQSPQQSPHPTRAPAPTSPLISAPQSPLSRSYPQPGLAHMRRKREPMAGGGLTQPPAPTSRVATTFNGFNVPRPTPSQDDCFGPEDNLRSRGRA